MNTVWQMGKQLLLSRKEAELQTAYAIPAESVSQYKIDLATKLVERIYAFCRDRGIGLLIVDIPTRATPKSGFFRSSIPPDLIEKFRSNSDVLILSDQVLEPFRGVTDTHMRNGHRHINQFSHLMFGMAVGEAILSILKDRIQLDGRE